MLIFIYFSFGNKISFRRGAGWAEQDKGCVTEEKTFIFSSVKSIAWIDLRMQVVHELKCDSNLRRLFLSGFSLFKRDLNFVFGDIPFKVSYFAL